ncbi:MAG: class III extradiol ring-cleavage dioxygenase [Ilumatobacteraceae bacterium]
MATASTTMPAVFIPHGGGPAFFMDGPMEETFRPMARFLAELDGTLPARPSAVLVVTAHWESPVVSITGGPAPSLIYDYFGFPAETYELTYPASGAPALAREVARLLAADGIEARVDDEHGWDRIVPSRSRSCTRTPVFRCWMSLHAGLDPRRSPRHRGRAAASCAMPGRSDRREWVELSQPQSVLCRRRRGRRLSTSGWTTPLHADADRARSLVGWASAPGARLCHPAKSTSSVDGGRRRRKRCSGPHDLARRRERHGGRGLGVRLTSPPTLHPFTVDGRSPRVNHDHGRGPAA